MILRNELEGYLNSLLLSNEIKDYCPNGLQIEGKEQISKIVTGVTACQRLINEAIKAQADAIIVHHGYFWKGEASPITGIQKQRISSILCNNINLFSYHLPLDIHKPYGNNFQLAQLLQLTNIKELDTNTSPNYGLIGQLNSPTSLNEIESNINNLLKRPPLTIEVNNKLITSIALCTGAGQNFIKNAASVGADLFVSGEISEKTTHLAREYDINYISAGHHATERYGVQAIGNHLAQQFRIEHEYIDIYNPV
jgi:dinuclear metal center YbgI/SA1388 family protein